MPPSQVASHCMFPQRLCCSIYLFGWHLLSQHNRLCSCQPTLSVCRPNGPRTLWVREIDGVGLSEVRWCVSGGKVNVVPVFWSVRSNNRLSRSTFPASTGFSVPSLLVSLGGQEMGRPSWLQCRSSNTLQEWSRSTHAHFFVPTSLHLGVLFLFLLMLSFTI